MKCPACGNEMPGIAKFCGFCGAQLNVPRPNRGLPPRYILFHTCGAVRCVVNNEAGTFWDVNGSGYIDLDTLAPQHNLERCNDGFRFENPENLTAIDFVGFKPLYFNMERMFYGCSRLSEIDLSGFKTIAVESIDSMFENCRSLTRINLNGWDLVDVGSYRQLFRGCESLRHISMRGCDNQSIDVIRRALTMACLQNHVMIDCR